jgi:hypothetical protein
LEEADFSPADRVLTCPQIGAERQTVEASIQQANGVIEANRKRDQAAAYFGGPLGLAAFSGTYSAEKDQIKQLSERRDVLIKLGTFRKCS